MNRRPSTWAWAVGIAWLLSGCGGTDHHDMRLFTTAEWNENPGSVDEMGYWISVDFGWPDRAHSCFDLPAGLHVTVNGREGIKGDDRDGDCLWDIVYDVGPFLPDESQAAHVRVLDGDKVLGEATYADFFPGTVARLASPTDGKVRLGDSVTLNLLSPFYGYGTSYGSYDFAQYYWLDSSDGMPPYYDLARVYLSEDKGTLTVETPHWTDKPSRTGRAALAINVSHHRGTTLAEPCTGFTHCEGWPSGALGPVFVEVVP